MVFLDDCAHVGTSPTRPTRNAIASLEDLDELKSLPCASPQWMATALLRCIVLRSMLRSFSYLLMGQDFYSVAESV